MVLKKYSVLALLVILALLLPVGSSIPAAANEDEVTLSSGSMSHGGYTRTWKYYVPNSYNASGDPVPLVFSFHGLGSSGQGQEDLTEFAELAKNEPQIYRGTIPFYQQNLAVIPSCGISVDQGQCNMNMMLMM